MTVTFFLSPDTMVTSISVFVADVKRYFFKCIASTLLIDQWVFVLVFKVCTSPAPFWPPPNPSMSSDAKKTGLSELVAFRPIKSNHRSAIISRTPGVQIGITSDVFLGFGYSTMLGEGSILLMCDVSETLTK